MSSKGLSAAGLETPVPPHFRIGEHVLLFPIASAIDEIAGPGVEIVRQFKLSAAQHRFILLQFGESVDLDSLAAPSEPDLLSFLDRHELSGVERSQFLAKLYGTFAPMLGLMTDRRFCACTTALFEDARLHHITGRIDAVLDYGTAILTYPARSHIAAGDVWITLGEAELHSGKLVAAVAPLALGNRRTRLAALETNGQPGRKCIAFSADRVTGIEASVHIEPEIGAFCAASRLRDPDILALLRQADPMLGARLTRELQPAQGTATLNLPHNAVSFTLDLALNLDHGLFVSGWYYDPDCRLAEVVAVDHTLEEPNLTKRWMTFSGRAEIDGELVSVTRFVGFLERQDDHGVHGFVLTRVTLTTGEIHLVVGGRPPADIASQRNAVLDAIAGHAVTAEMMQSVFVPAVHPLQQQINARQKVRHVREFGQRSLRAVSIVIPLYKETAFIRSQLMAFAVDPFVRSHCEIVYVLDDPLIAGQVNLIFQGSEYAFTLDLKLVVLDQNGGFALANNYGVREAEGEVLVLLNSDVIPTRPGWVQTAVAKLEALPPYSVIGPKLLYADESLQHAGMYFFRLMTGNWQNFHFWKGYARNFAPAMVERDVPATTGACMILNKRDFLAVGGFTADYVVGDYEDSDLCLKFRREGGAAYYMPSIELFHFERQSMPKDEDQRDRGATIYNRALHTIRWGEAIENLMNLAKVDLHV